MNALVDTPTASGNRPCNLYIHIVTSSIRRLFFFTNVLVSHLLFISIPNTCFGNSPTSITSYLFTYRLQDERMEVLKTMLYQREVDHQALNDKRLEHLW